DRNRDLDALADDVAYDVVNGETVRDVAAGAVDEEADRPVALARELAQPLDAEPRRILFDIAYQINVAQAIVLFLAELGPNRIHKLGKQLITQFRHSFIIASVQAQPHSGP